jgi:hypothetical protein
MKTPRLSAEHAMGPAHGVYGALAGRTAGPFAHPGGVITPQATLSCLAGCVGPSSADLCSAQCGADLACWQSCAGISDTSCVAACYAT